MSDVFVLGAGFSKAICDRMPTLADLSDELVLALPEPLGRLRESLGPDLEAWLTFLAEDQPWLTPVEAEHNHANFVDASTRVGHVLSSRQAYALGQPMPQWLMKLIAYWHETKSVVITLNYDTLVEKAYMQLIPPERSGGKPDHHEIYPVPIQFTEFRTGMGGVRPRYEGTFQLIKLHGSINWCYSGHHPFWGETIYDVGLIWMALNSEGKPVGPWSAEAAEPVGHLEREAPDKVTLIIPPTSTKSALFENETIRQLWRAAYEALSAAERVYCLGYSLPETDQLVGFMVATGLQPSCTVVPANTDPKAAERYDKLGRVDTSYVGVIDPIPSLVDRLTSDLSKASPGTK